MIGITSQSNIWRALHGSSCVVTSNEWILLIDGQILKQLTLKLGMQGSSHMDPSNSSTHRGKNG